MLLRHKLGLETIMLLLFTVAISNVLVWYYNHNSRQNIQVEMPVLQQAQEDTIAPTAEPTPSVQKSSQISPDGKKVLAMQVTQNPDQTYSYLVTAKDADGANETQLFATSSADLKLSLPFNAWSPDDAYVFVQKGETDALVFRASGEPITPDQPYLEVASRFQATNPDIKIAEITGWAGYREVVVNSAAPDGTQGQSFWYEVPSGGIIPLSTKF